MKVSGTICQGPVAFEVPFSVRTLRQLLSACPIAAVVWALTPMRSAVATAVWP